MLISNNKNQVSDKNPISATTFILFFLFIISIICIFYFFKTNNYETITEPVKADQIKQSLIEGVSINKLNNKDIKNKEEIIIKTPDEVCYLLGHFVVSKEPFEVLKKDGVIEKATWYINLNKALCDIDGERSGAYITGVAIEKSNSSQNGFKKFDVFVDWN